MSLLDPKARSEHGAEQQAKLLGLEQAPDPTSVLEASKRDYLFAEVWTRPELDLRSRYLISISGASTADTSSEMLDGYIRGALQQELLTVGELREAALHLAVYSGWSRGGIMDQAIHRVVAELGIKEEPIPPIRESAWDPQERLQKGAEEFKNVMTFGGPPPMTAYFEGGILNFVFGEMWHREGLDQRGRRWITLVGVSDSSSDIPIRTHIYGAMASGNATADEMFEFVLQYAVHSGWPKASVIQGVVFEMAEKVKNGLFWDGRPLEEVNNESKN